MQTLCESWALALEANSSTSSRHLACKHPHIEPETKENMETTESIKSTPKGNHAKGNKHSKLNRKGGTELQFKIRKPNLLKKKFTKSRTM